MAVRTVARVDKQTLEAMVKAAGMLVSKRQRGNITYLYLVKRVPGQDRILSRYLGAESRIVALTPRKLRDEIRELSDRVGAVQRGEEPPARAPKLSPITADQVLQAMGTGASLATIAERLGVSARSPRLRAVLVELREAGKIKSGRWYEPTND